LICTLDWYIPSAVLEEPVELFCNTPRSISDPLPITAPCSVTTVLLVPNASVSDTVTVQSAFST